MDVFFEETDWLCSPGTSFAHLGESHGEGTDRQTQPWTDFATTRKNRPKGRFFEKCMLSFHIVRQCPKLGIKSFQRNGVRNTLIPLLVSYFQERYQSVKWRGFNTSPKLINVGGPQGATLGILEYLSQTSNSAECVPPEDCFKFVDDLTILEIVNLLTIGLSSYNVKHQVPNDIGEDKHFISPDNLKSQEYLNEINEWTKKQRNVD